MAVGDIYKVKVTTKYTPTQEAFVNDFYYTATEVGGSAANLYDAFIDTDGMLDLLMFLMSGAFFVDSVEVENLFSLTDFYVGAPSVTGGGGTVDSLPVHNAMSFTKKLDTKGVRPGGWRIAGLWEAVVSNGIISDSGYITGITAFRIAAANDIIGEGGINYDPIVVKRIAYTVDEGEDDERQGYRLPANAGEANFGHITAVLVNLRVSHQVSRGNGR